MASKFSDLIEAIDVFASAALIKNSFIKKLSNGKWKVKKAEAKPSVIDLSDLEDISYSAIMRKLRKIDDPEIVLAFLSIYKELFDGLIELNSSDAANQALPVTLMIFSQVYPIKLSENQND